MKLYLPFYELILKPWHGVKYNLENGEFFAWKYVGTLISSTSLGFVLSCKVLAEFPADLEYWKMQEFQNIFKPLFIKKT